MLLVSNVLSFVIVITCWWLAHLFSLRSTLLARIIASLFAVVAMLVMVITVFRNLEMNIDGMALITKGVYAVLFIALGVWVNDSKRIVP